MQKIPLQLLVDPSDFPPGPPGPPGAGIVAKQWAQSFAPGQNTISGDLVASGVFLEVDAVNETDRFEIDIQGVVGTSFNTGTHVPLVVCRNGTPLLPAGSNFHSANYLATNTVVGPFAIALTDAPAMVGPIRYELWFKSFAAAAFLGRRGIDATALSISTNMRVRRLIGS